MNEQTLHVTGMTCDHCAVSVKKALLAVDGVTGADVSYPDATTRVEVAAGTPVAAFLEVDSGGLI